MFVENDSSINRNKILSFKVVIFVKELTFHQRKISSFKIIILVKSSILIFFAKKTSFNETSYIIIINEYRPSHIDVKNVIAFAFLKMKKTYNARY